MSRLTDKNRLSIAFPELAKEWNYAKNKGLNPEGVSYGSERLVWWKCCQCGHEWQAPIYYRSTKKSNNCVYCNSLWVKNPGIAAEWNYIRNGRLLPQEVFSKGSQKVWWKCKICSHEWKTQVCSRTTPTRKTGCPKCKRKRANDGNSLASLNPELAKEWNYDKNNGLTPNDFTVNSHKIVWWNCLICGHEWQDTVNQRNNIGNSCWRCKSLAIRNPETAKEWHLTKNGTLTPFDVSKGSSKRVWWKCLQCGHEWRAVVDRRTAGRGCPACSKVFLKDGTVCDSIPEAYVYLKYKEQGVKFVHGGKYGAKIGNRRYDFYLADENKYVEVTSFNKNSMGIRWMSYLRNIVLKKKYVEKVLNSCFEFIQFTPRLLRFCS